MVSPLIWMLTGAWAKSSSRWVEDPHEGPSTMTDLRFFLVGNENDGTANRNFIVSSKSIVDYVLLDVL